MVQALLVRDNGAGGGGGSGGGERSGGDGRDPALSAALAQALLEHVAAGHADKIVRVAIAAPALALSKLDLASGRGEAAAASARAHGFPTVVRLVGGRAAALSAGVVEVGVFTRERDPRRGVRERFELHAGAIVRALSALGIKARAGEVAGEWCPGAFSVGVGGRVKLAGIGQRIVAGGVCVGAVVVGDDAPRLRAVLTAAYRALGLSLDPDTVGSVAAELARARRAGERPPAGAVPAAGAGYAAGGAAAAADGPSATTRALADALAATYSELFALEPAPLPAAVLARAHELRPQHLPPWERQRVGAA
ncbi:lipoate--protein ligase family protein [Thermoleophilum album]|uniref:lipoyl protein ligase domain-containing protein n=1 Tax=Thermoleophilum album TaxID=29539 RepID=UPI00237D20BB|nr:hypothetical protein [Thermoleophilum album]WDT93204.1 lipoate--protein ligase family protein [Thermoleophilum album]